MHIVEIQSSHEQTAFFESLSKSADKTSNDSSISRWIFKHDSAATGKYTVGYGDFEWYDSETKQTFTVRYHQEGKPLSMGISTDIGMFERLTIEHESAEILKAFVTRIMTPSPSVEAQKIKLFNSRSKGYWEPSNDICAQSFENIFMPSDIKDTVMTDVNTFLAAQERYIKFGRMHKFSFLFSGVPGSGKTSLAKSLALKFKRPLYVLNLTKTLEDECMIELFNGLKNDSILLIEDIDAFFVDRKAEDVNVSFSCLLNVLDGAMGNLSGVIVILTANNPDRLDPALIRPGRIDRILHFDYPKKKEIQKAFLELVDPAHATQQRFDEFWDQIKGRQINMSAFIDLFFRHPTNYAEKVDAFLHQNHLLKQITAEKIERVYT